MNTVQIFQSQTILLILLIKVGVIAAIATLLIRTDLLKGLLFKPGREGRNGLFFALLFSGIMALGNIFRMLLGYHATDFSLSGTIVAGLLFGSVYGGLTGVLTSIPAMINGELWSLPFGIFNGVTAGLLRLSFHRNDDLFYRIYR